MVGDGDVLKINEIAYRFHLVGHLVRRLQHLENIPARRRHQGALEQTPLDVVAHIVAPRLRVPHVLNDVNELLDILPLKVAGEKILEQHRAIEYRLYEIDDFRSNLTTFSPEHRHG